VTDDKLILGDRNLCGDGDDRKTEKPIIYPVLVSKRWNLTGRNSRPTLRDKVLRSRVRSVNLAEIQNKLSWVTSHGVCLAAFTRCATDVGSSDTMTVAPDLSVMVVYGTCPITETAAAIAATSIGSTETDDPWALS
jgi:hypothetical protein